MTAPGNPLTRPVPARTLVESALALLVEYRKYVEQPPDSKVHIEARTLRTIEQKLRAAMEGL